MKQSITLLVLLFFLVNFSYAQNADGDSIPDLIDTDDDNDGITDCNESAAHLTDASFRWTLNTPVGTLEMDETSDPTITDWAVSATDSMIISGITYNVTSSFVEITQMPSATLAEAELNGDYIQVAFTTGAEAHTFNLKDVTTGWFMENNEGDSFYMTLWYKESTSSTWTTLSEDVFRTPNDPSYSDFDHMDISNIFLTSNTTYQFRFYVYNQVDDSAASRSIFDDVFFFFDACQALDTDGDGTPDHLDLDSDNDKCYDVVESEGVDANNDGILDGTGFSATGTVVGGSGGYNGVTGNEVVATNLTVNDVPQDQSANEGDTASFSINVFSRNTTNFTASGAPDFSFGQSTFSFFEIEYQWYLGDPDAGGVALSNSSVYSNVTGNSLTIRDVTGLDGNSYYVEVTHENNVCLREVHGATLTVTNPCDALASGNLDTDGDGISDICDQDDDNDGIIDTYECSAAIQFNAPSLLTATTLSDVKVGEKVLYENALFFQNRYYDIVLTVTAINGTFTVSCNAELNMSDTSPINDSYVSYALDLVEAGSATPDNPEGTTTVLYDLILQLRDNDSNNGSDFTEINGFNATTVTRNVRSYLAPTTVLEVGGFINTPDPAGYTLYRLNPTLSGDTTNWSSEGASGNDETTNFLYLDFDVFSHVDLIFGTTGSATSTGLRLTKFGAQSSCDSDNDGLLNTLDIDSDDDGIPDNVEAQSTAGYRAPSGTIDPATGIDTSYGTGIVPVDTDRDNLVDMFDSDTDNDGTPDIEENGQANVLTHVDADTDGLDDNLDAVTGVLDVNDEVTNGALAELIAVFGDVDEDAALGGDLDYRDLFDGNPPATASIDFDGVDDYLSTNAFIEGLPHVSIMAWVKTDAGNTTDMVLAGEDTGCKLWLENGVKPMFTVRTLHGEVTVSCGCTAINQEEWHHLTGVYSSETGRVSLYVDGVLAHSEDTGHAGATIASTDAANGYFEVGRLSTKDVTDHLYFKGAIDEVRVFDVALTEAQVQNMVYQEINENNALLQGATVPKPIVDNATGETVSWAHLIAYYPMTNIITGKTSDYSSYDNDLYLNYINTVQDQTAPMPYLASHPGAWTLESVWAHGAVWDIEDIVNNKSWSIVKIAADVTTNHDIVTAGLLIDSGAKLTVQNDHAVRNTSYLELNGTLDLLGDAQLLQSATSDLVTAANGKILRRQEGATNPYWYNYWCSPVGEPEETSLLDANKNTNFRLNMLKDGLGEAIEFTRGFTANGTVSSYWLFTLINGVSYYDWAQIPVTRGLSPGVGYTQKGTGGPNADFIFEGKPNNGPIEIEVEDRASNGTDPTRTRTNVLVGNPYPSALDIDKFIDDNAGVISGTISLWQQWSGNSHVLDEYNGGYAQVNKTGGVRASQFVGIEGGTTNGYEGTKVPTAYMPVGQGFIVEVVADGHIKFNNGQRVFVKETPSETGSGENSIFFKDQSVVKSQQRVSENSQDSKDASVIEKIRLEFNAVTGPAVKRELLLGFSTLTTDAYDYGYEAEIETTSNSDLNLILEGKHYNIQAYGAITSEKAVPLHLNASGDYTFEIKMTALENLPEDQEVYLRDHLTGAYFDLRQEQSYRFTSEQGVFNERLELVFQSEAATLSTEETAVASNYIYYNKKENTLYAKKLTEDISKFAIYNLNGQKVMEMNTLSRETLSRGIPLSNMSSGAYIACLKTKQTHQLITKKIIKN